MSPLPPPSAPENGIRFPGWKRLAMGGVMTHPGSSEAYKTGNWDAGRRVCFNPKTCINCNLCWPVCPDDAIIVDEKGNMIGIDEEHCKRCGLCVEACPTKEKSLFFEEKKGAKI